MKSGFWILILIVGASCLVLLPNPKETWKRLSDFMLCLLLLVFFLSWYWLSKVWKKIQWSAEKMKKLVTAIVYRPARDWETDEHYEHWV